MSGEVIPIRSAPPDPPESFRHVTVEHTIVAPRLPPGAHLLVVWSTLVALAAVLVGWVVDPSWLPVGAVVAFMVASLAAVVGNLIVYNRRDRLR